MILLATSDVERLSVAEVYVKGCQRIRMQNKEADLLAFDARLVDVGYVRLLQGSNFSDIFSQGQCDYAPLRNKNVFVFRYTFNPEDIYAPETWVRAVRCISSDTPTSIEALSHLLELFT